MKINHLPSGLNSDRLWLLDGLILFADALFKGGHGGDVAAGGGQGFDGLKGALEGGAGFGRAAGAAENFTLPKEPSFFARTAGGGCVNAVKGATCLAVNPTHVFWTTLNTPGFRPGRVWKAVKGGGPAVGLAGGESPTAMAVDDTAVYWVDAYGRLGRGSAIFVGFGGT